MTAAANLGDGLGAVVSATGPAHAPLGRIGWPEEVSAVVDFLLSPGAACINGQVIGVEGEAVREGRLSPPCQVPDGDGARDHA